MDASRGFNLLGVTCKRVEGGGQQVTWEKPKMHLNLLLEWISYYQRLLSDSKSGISLFTLITTLSHLNTRDSSSHGLIHYLNWCGLHF